MSPSPFLNLMTCTCVSMLFNLFVFVMTTVCWVCVYVWLPRKPSVGVTFHITFLHLISSFRWALHPTWTMKCGNCLYQDSHLVPGTALYSCIWACMNTRRHTDTYLHTHVCALTHAHTHWPKLTSMTGERRYSSPTLSLFCEAGMQPSLPSTSEAALFLKTVALPSLAPPNNQHGLCCAISSSSSCCLWKTLTRWQVEERKMVSIYMLGETEPGII